MNESKDDPFKPPFAEYYDLLYSEKDYASECGLVQTVIDRYADGAVQSIVDLGCGTGNHSIVLAESGYSVVGVDRAAGMLAFAREKAAKRNLSIEWIESDIQAMPRGLEFDVALAMFAVLSFQLKNRSVLEALRSIHGNLRRGGLLIGDVWHGPAVLWERPEKRLRMVEGKEISIYRYATPEIDLFHHTNDVNQHVLVIDNNTKKVIAEVREKQTIRYFFPQEFELFLSQSGFQLERYFSFPQLGEDVTAHDWNLGFVARSIGPA
jgi:SAM-dependent methyltransferase